MALGRKLAVGSALLASIPAGAVYGTAKWMETTDQVPEVLGHSLTPVEELPPFLPLKNKDGLICTENEKRCDKVGATAVLAARYQIPKPLAEMGQIQNVVVPIEDRTFYENKNGVSGRGVARAILSTMSGNKQGGSTITSQTAKMVFAPASEETLRQEGVEKALLELDNSLARRIMRKIPLKEKIPKFGEKLAAFDNPAETRKFIREAALQYHEFRLAMKLKEIYSDEQILEMYLNNVPLGRNTYGVEAGSQAMFGKSAKDLGVYESALLVAQLTGPSNKDIDFTTYADTDLDKVADPAKKAELLKLKQERAEEISNLQARTIRIINQLALQGVITAEEADAYRKIDLQADLRKYIIPFQPRPEVNMKNAEPIGAEHVVQMARSQALDILKGITNNPEMKKEDLAGYTIRLNINSQAQAALTKAIREDGKLKANNLEAAGVILDTQGRIVALTGSTDYKKTQVNMAIGQAGGGSGRPAGSGLKPFAAILALENGLPLHEPVLTRGTPVTITGPKKYKEPGQKGTKSYPDFTPKVSHGCGQPSCPPASVADAIARSINESTADMIERAKDPKVTGIEKFKQKLNIAGIPVAEPYGPSAFGAPNSKKEQPSIYTPLQLATAYAGIVNDGQSVRADLIAEILDHDGKVVYRPPAHQSQSITTPEVADYALEAMAGTVKYGTAKDAFDLSRGEVSVAGKTGTSNNVADAWFNFTFCGQNVSVSHPASKYAASIWTGHAEGQTAQTDKKTAMSSKDVARIGGRAVSAMIQSSEPCDVRN